MRLMPGVLILEAMHEAGLWLVRRTENFVHAVVMLNEARNASSMGHATTALKPPALQARSFFTS